jgi:hypothetical protein
VWFCDYNFVIIDICICLKLNIQNWERGRSKDIEVYFEMFDYIILQYSFEDVEYFACV